jgi:hypothetical protein
MNKRPISIIVIAWILIILGALSLISITIILTKGLKGTSLPSPIIEYALMYTGALSYFVSGIAMLRGQNWARFLFLIWQVIYFIIRLVRNPFTTGMVPVLFIFFIVPAFFLFRPHANDYFAGREIKESKSKIITEKEERVGRGRNLISVICYVISGIFFYIAGSLSFLNKPWIFFKSALLGVFCLLALLFLIIGLISSRFQNLYRHVGLVCTWAAGYTTFSVFSTWSLMNDPKFVKAFPAGFPQLFSAVVSGVVCLALLGIIGILFLLIPKKKVQQFSGPV